MIFIQKNKKSWKIKKGENDEDNNDDGTNNFFRKVLNKK